MTKYFYWPPSRRQFFFPQSIPFVKLINDFYKPYKFKAKLGWYIFLHSTWFQKKFSIKEKEIPVPLDTIKKQLSDNNIPFSYFLINLGTPGIEQKRSIIIIDQNKNKIAVIKFAKNALPIKLIENEGKYLSQIHPGSFSIPNIILYKKNSDFAILIFTYLEGIKLPENACSPKIINIIKTIISLSDISLKNDLLYTFAHGDFCPWNILVDSNGKYSLIDWEMAGEYPLGYDLFTFIFQTYFLISNKSPKKLLRIHIDIIFDFFKKYNIYEWAPYLKAFCFMKMSKKNIKEQKVLHNKYKQLSSIV